MTSAKETNTAFDWLTTNGGAAAFDPTLTTLTNGDAVIDYDRDVWIKLRDAGKIEFFNDSVTTPCGGVRLITKDDAE
jgi:hypothetical protein